MHRKKLDAVTQLIHTASLGARVALSADLPPEGVPRDGRTYVPVPDGFLGLTEEGLDATLTLHGVLTEHWGRFEVFEEVTQRMYRLVRGAIGASAEDITALVEAAHAEVTTQPERTVMVPVVGVRVDGPIDLGHLHLRPLAVEVRKELADLSPGDAKLQLTPEMYVEWALRDFTSTVASFRAAASGMRTLERAQAYAEAVLPLLVLTRRPALRGADFPGSAPELDHASLVINANSRSPHRPPRLASPGPQHLPAVILNGLTSVQRARVREPEPTVHLTQATLDDSILPMVLGLVDREFGGEPLNSFETTFLRAARWYVNAAGQRDPANAVIGLVTCLEVLFSPAQQEGQPISGAVAEAVAFLHRDVAADRKALYKEMKRLYALRSSITHGKTSAVKPVDLAALDGHALRTLYAMGRGFGHLTTREALLEEIHSLRWEGPGLPGLDIPLEDEQPG